MDSQELFAGLGIESIFETSEIELELTRSTAIDQVTFPDDYNMEVIASSGIFTE